jgi:hypothetical protein
MSETSTTLGLLAEIFTIVCFPLGLLLLIVALLTRAIRGGWFEIEATVSGSELRWLGRDGVLYTQELDDEERVTLGDAEQVTVYCRTFSPYRAQLERVAHDEKLLRVLGNVFIAVGVVAVIVSVFSAVAL